MMEIVYEGNELLYSGRICCYDNKSIKLVHRFEENSKLTLIFNFNYDEEPLRYKISSPENGTVVIDLFNFSNALGSGLKKPAEIGRYKGKKIELIFYVYKFEDASPILDISMYLEK